MFDIEILNKLSYPFYQSVQLGFYGYTLPM
jgi:hypothetical protein